MNNEIKTIFGSAIIIDRMRAFALDYPNGRPMVKIRITQPGPHMNKTTWIKSDK